MGTYKKPCRDVHPPSPLRPWCNLAEEEAWSAVMNKQSLMLCGAPRYAKTFVVRELVKALRTAGKRVDVIAKTHASVQIFGEYAQTTDHWVRQRVRAGDSIQCDVLVCE